MNLFTVRHKNPFWPLGTFVEKFSDGVEKCIVGNFEGRMTIDGHEGLVIPFAECESFLMQVRSRGLDAGSERASRRKAQGQFHDQGKEEEEESVQELCDTVHERKLWPADGSL